ncbi:MAG: Rab family GTPase [Thermoplasmata archaeon]
MSDYIKKIVMLGNPAVGKTSLVRKYVDNMFDEKYLTTIGAHPTKREIVLGGDKIILMIWDLAGQNFGLHPAYYSGTAGALLVCDLTRKDTADSLPAWRSALLAKSKELPILVLANKADLPNHEFELKDLKMKGFDVMSTSAKTGENVEKAFAQLTGRIIHG